MNNKSCVGFHPDVRAIAQNAGLPANKLKNGSKLPKPNKPEDNKKFAQRRYKVAIKIKRLKEQIWV